MESRVFMEIKARRGDSPQCLILFHCILKKINGCIKLFAMVMEFIHKIKCMHGPLI